MSRTPSTALRQALRQAQDRAQDTSSGHRVPRARLAVGLLALVAFAIGAASLDTQSLWRDEVDALCYAIQFEHLLKAALVPLTATEPVYPCACPPPPFPAQEQAGALLAQRLRHTLAPMLRQNGPFYFLLLRRWIGVAGTSEFALRFPSLFFRVLCIPLTYVLGCRLWRSSAIPPRNGGASDSQPTVWGDASPALQAEPFGFAQACGGGFNRLVGFFGSLLVTASPYLTWYGQEAKMYALVPALVLLALYALRRAVDEGGWRWWTVQVIATSLAFYAHILAALLIPVQVVLYFAWWPRSQRRWIGALVSLACLTLPYLPLATWQAPTVLQARETGFYPYSLGEMAQILLNGWSTGLLGWGWPWGAVLMGALAVWGLVGPLTTPLRPSSSPCRRGEGEGLGVGMGSRLALVAWLVTPLLGVWLISLRQPLFTDRYLIWAAPAFYLLAGSGLALLRHWRRWLALIPLAALLVVGGGNLWLQATRPIKSDFRAAAAYVAEHRRADELILFQIPHGRYTFDYYYPDEGYAWAEGLYTNHLDGAGGYLMSETEAAWRMASMTVDYDLVWLVATETTMWDERGLVQAWLDANGERVDEAHFARVEVVRYVLPGLP